MKLIKRFFAWLQTYNPYGKSPYDDLPLNW